jgi:hypothetical protein
MIFVTQDPINATWIWTWNHEVDKKKLLLLWIHNTTNESWQQMAIPLTELASEDSISAGCMNVGMILEGSFRREGLLTVRTSEHLARVAVAVPVAWNNKKNLAQCNFQNVRKYGINRKKNTRLITKQVYFKSCTNGVLDTYGTVTIYTGTSTV